MWIVAASAVEVARYAYRLRSYVGGSGKKWEKCVGMWRVAHQPLSMSKNKVGEK